jgi:phosphohistidine phosphatase
MDLFLIRHAIAVTRTPEQDDALRPLTARGRRRWRKAVRGLARLGVGFDRVLHSPARRARQTAKGLRSLVEGELVETARLAQAPARALLEEVSGARVALVGHEPWLSELLAWLTVGSAELGPRFMLGKGAVAWLEGSIAPGGMRLRALWSGKVLRAIG